jgi:hypothetical protein
MKEMDIRLKRKLIELEKNLCKLYIWDRIDNQNTQGAQETKLPHNHVAKW